ncbi:MAG: HAMP domain-containing protein, partial [Desulfovibrionaceae bacterium]
MMDVEHTAAHDMKRKSQRSLSRDLTVSLVALLALVLGVLLAVDYSVRSGETRSEAELQAEEQVDKLAGILSIPVWNLDAHSILQIGTAFCQQAAVSRVRVLDADGQVLFDRGDDPVAEEAVLRTAPISAPVLTDEGPIGTAELTVDAAVLRKGLRQTLSVMGLTFLGVILVLAAATGVLLRIFIRRPLEGLREAMARVARGDFSTPLGSTPYQELDGIVASFRSMTGEVRQREAALQDQVSERRRA